MSTGKAFTHVLTFQNNFPLEITVAEFSAKWKQFGSDGEIGWNREKRLIQKLI